MATHPSSPRIWTRIDPVLAERIKSEADRRFEGNESLVVRDAVRTYLRLRDHLGSQFESTLDEIAPLEPVSNGAAA